MKLMPLTIFLWNGIGITCNMKKIIHINQHKIKAKEDKVITVKTYKDNTYGSSVEINGPCRIVYSPDKPLSCGARVWIETESEVIVK